jgi:hypothetical protein
MEILEKYFVNFVSCTWLGLGYLILAFQFWFGFRVYLFLFGSVRCRSLLVYIDYLCTEATMFETFAATA